MEFVPEIGSGNCELTGALARMRCEVRMDEELVRRCPRTRCHQSGPLAVMLPHKARRLGDVTVVAHHDRAVMEVQPAVVWEMNGMVNI